MSASRSPRLVCLAPTVPQEEVDHAGGLYLYRYLRGMVELGWGVALLAPATEANRSAAERLAATDPRVDVILQSLQGRGRLHGASAYVLEGAVAGSPLARVPSEATLDALREADVLDLQWYETYSYAGQVRALAPRAVTVATVHDVYRDALKSTLRSDTRWRRLAALAGMPACSQREVTALNDCDRVYAFRSRDLDQLARRGVRTPGETIMPYVDLTEPRPRASPSGQRLVFPAAMWRAENAEAARWFLDAVWPRVVRRHPEATFVIAGSKPPPDLLARASGSVEVTGFLPSLWAALDGASGVVAPIRRGAGLKFKVLQAMALGYPVMGMPEAFSGLEDFFSTPPAGARSAAELAQQLDSLLATPDRYLVNALALAEDLAPRLSFSDALRRRSDELLRSRGQFR